MKNRAELRVGSIPPFRGLIRPANRANIQAHQFWYLQNVRLDPAGEYYGRPGIEAVGETVVWPIDGIFDAGDRGNREEGS